MTVIPKRPKRYLKNNIQIFAQSIARIENVLYKASPSLFTGDLKTMPQEATTEAIEQSTPAPIEYSYEGKTYTMSGLEKFNIIIGRNGCGKSTALRGIFNKKTSLTQHYKDIYYLPPERVGQLLHDSGVEQQMIRDGYITDTRGKINVSQGFRQQAATHYRTLRESISNLAYEENRTQDELSLIHDTINNVLENIYIKLSSPIFSIHSKYNNSEINEKNISSGEMQLISMIIDILHFVLVKASDTTENYLLVIDEPDVHLHPALQLRFMNTISELIEDKNIDVLIATHSASILGAVALSDESTVCYMFENSTRFEFKRIPDSTSKLVPLFGAHILPIMYSDCKLLILEGSDDVQIWAEAVRMNTAKLRLYPCHCNGKTNMPDYEKNADMLLNALSSGDKGFSLQDGDGAQKSKHTVGAARKITRSYLQCYSSENLLLTTQVLMENGTNWQEMKQKLSEFIVENPQHPKVELLKSFKSGRYNRVNFKIKGLEKIIVGLFDDSRRPWQFHIGQAIGNLVKNDVSPTYGHGSIFKCLGRDVVTTLLDL